MKKVQIPKENTPTNYLVVRVQLVHVKKRLIGFKDKPLTALSIIPNTPKEAVEFFNEIGAFSSKYGKNILKK